jgi:hypothetical protein
VELIATAEATSTAESSHDPDPVRQHATATIGPHASSASSFALIGTTEKRHRL